MVLGASMAGLLAARVLSDAYERVTVVDRDALPAIGEHRRGVPQGRHANVVHARGAQVLDELFPGLTAEVVAAGAPTGDLLGTSRMIVSGHRLRKVDIGVPMLYASRPLLEGHVLARVRALPGVTIADTSDIVDLTATPDRRRVTGVRVRDSAGELVTIDADLVLDATGRGSRTPLWLDSLGYPRPRTDKVHVGIGYSSRYYRLPPEAMGGDRLILHNWTPGYPKGGAVLAQEGDRYLVTLVGMLGDHPPADPEGFLTFAAGLPFDDIHDVLRAGEPLDDPVVFRYPANVRHRYERLRSFPDGLLALGDAVSSFNPIYAQGITAATLQAAELRRLLSAGGPPTWRRYFRAIAKVIDNPWEIATGTDLGLPEVIGRRTPKIRLVNAYLPRLHAVATTDATLATAFVRVAAMLDAPAGLLRPDRVLRVLRGRRSAGEPPADRAPSQPAAPVNSKT